MSPDPTSCLIQRAPLLTASSMKCLTILEYFFSEWKKGMDKTVCLLLLA